MNRPAIVCCAALLANALFGISSSRAATIQTEGDTITEVLGLQVGASAYDVAFVTGAFKNLNSGSTFLFLDDQQGAAALVGALTATLPGSFTFVGTGASSCDPGFGSCGRTTYLVPFNDRG